MVVQGELAAGGPVRPLSVAIGALRQLNTAVDNATHDAEIVRKPMRGHKTVDEGNILKPLVRCTDFGAVQPDRHLGQKIHQGEGCNCCHPKRAP